MIVCSCNVLSDRDVRTAVAADARRRSPGQVYYGLGCGMPCGRCAPTIRRIIDETLAEVAAVCENASNPAQS